MIFSPLRKTTCLCFLLLYGLPSAPALSIFPSLSIRSIALLPQQQPEEAQNKNTQQGTAQDSYEEADEPASPIPEKTKSNSSAVIDLTWEMLTSAISNPKAQVRIDGLNAIGSLPNSPRTQNLIDKALQDQDRDVRVAAVIAIGNMHDRTFIPKLRLALDDRTPEVSFAAAVALWKMHDPTGENILGSVLLGEQKASSGFFSSGLHEAGKDLHNPSTLARMGAEQGAYAMLGPFGIGLDAFRLLHKSNSGNSARVLAANLLSTSSDRQVREGLIVALRDKDYFVRGASAQALGSFRGSDVTTALMQAFGDPKPAVRFLAAASYIRSTTPSAGTRKQKATVHNRKDSKKTQ